MTRLGRDIVRIVKAQAARWLLQKLADRKIGVLVTRTFLTCQTTARASPVGSRRADRGARGTAILRRRVPHARAPTGIPARSWEGSPTKKVGYPKQEAKLRAPAAGIPGGLDSCKELAFSHIPILRSIAVETITARLDINRDLHHRLVGKISHK